MVTKKPKKPKKPSPFEGLGSIAVAGTGIYMLLKGGAAGAFLGIGMLVLLGCWGSVRARARQGANAVRTKLSSPCAICGSPNVDGHGCHVEAIAVRAGRETRRRRDNGQRYEFIFWKGHVRDHYGLVEGTECDHRHRRRIEAQTCAWRKMRKIQEGVLEAAVVGPRPGAETVVHRVPIDDLDWPKLIERAGYRCAYCKEEFQPHELQREHVVPLSRGGTNHPTNIVPACGPCNREKGTRTGEEYEDFLARTQDRKRGTRKRASGAPRPANGGTRQLPNWKVCTCGGTFKLRSGRYGRFYGCSRFPSCRETRPLRSRQK